MTQYLENQTYLIYDTSSSTYAGDPLSHFALDDALLRLINQDGSRPILHFWPINSLVILGMMDTKLPYLEAGLHYLQDEGWPILVRPAGGLAVVADPGVLNFSFILPEPEAGKLSIDDGYEVMLAFIRRLFAPFGKEIVAQEIADSYCPGDYDLSIDGRKFAGIAQRRFKRGIGVMIYLSVEGDQERRGQLIRTFYERGRQGEETRWHYPEVNPASMANLSDLLGLSLTVSQLKEMILATLENWGNSVVKGEYAESLLEDYAEARIKMQKRNEQVFQTFAKKERRGEDES